MYMPYFKIEILTSREVTTLLSFEQLGPGDCLIQVASKTGLPVHVPQSQQPQITFQNNQFSQQRRLDISTELFA